MAENKQFRDSFREETGFEWRPWRWASTWLGVIVMLMVVGGILSAAVFGISVATSDARGRGEAVELKNDALNRTQAQAQFHATFESIRSLDQRLNDAQVQLDQFNQQHPNVGNGTAYDPLAEQQANLQRTVTGLQQQCRNTSADYNASTETYTLRDFRDSDLPYKIESSDPIFSAGTYDFADFDCQPSK